MGYQVIKQPDGRLCIFSNNSDTIIARDRQRFQPVSVVLNTIDADNSKDKGDST